MSTRFNELYIEGDPGTLRGFLAGFRCGCETRAPIFINVDHGVADDGFARQLAENIHLVETVTHVLVAGEVSEDLVSGIEQRGRAVGLRVHGRRAVRRASVAFHWEVYSPDEAARARRLFESDKPPSIELEDYHPERIVDDKARETGMYTAAHAFTEKARGTAYGPPDALIHWVEQLRQDDFIHVDTIRLVYEEKDPSA